MQLIWYKFSSYHEIVHKNLSNWIITNFIKYTNICIIKTDVDGKKRKKKLNKDVCSTKTKQNIEEIINCSQRDKENRISQVLWSKGSTNVRNEH